MANLKKKIVPILKEHEVQHASVFGSYAYGKVNRSSDLDLLVEFEGNKSLLDLVALKNALKKAVKRDVDVLTPKSLHPLLKKHVMKKTIKVL